MEPVIRADDTDLLLHGQRRVKHYTKEAYHITGHNAVITKPDDGHWNFTEESRSPSEENTCFSITQVQPVCYHPRVNLIDIDLEFTDGGESVRKAEGKFQLRVIGISVKVQVVSANDIANLISSVTVTTVGFNTEPGNRSAQVQSLGRDATDLEWLGSNCKVRRNQSKATLRKTNLGGQALQQYAIYIVHRVNAALKSTSMRQDTQCLSEEWSRSFWILTSAVSTLCSFR